MKQISFYINNNSIQFSNDWMGYETITVNNEQVSKKFSFFGTKHNFNIADDNITENYTIKSDVSFKNNVIITLYKDDVKIEEKFINYFENYDVNFNSTFVIGLIFILYALIDGESKYLGFLGLIFIITSFRKKPNSSEKTNPTKN